MEVTTLSSYKRRLNSSEYIYRNSSTTTRYAISIFSITHEVFVMWVWSGVEWVSTDQYGSSITVKMLFLSFAIVLSLSEGDVCFFRLIFHRTPNKNTKEISNSKNWKLCYVFIVIFTHVAVILFIDFYHLYGW